MVIAASFLVVKKWKQSKWAPTDEWISKIWSIHTVEYYSAIKRNGVLTHATTWVNPEEITLSETGQNQKDKYCMIPLT